MDQEVKRRFGLDEKELRWSDDLGASVFKTVGFVFKENNILVIFPKHYYSAADLVRFNSSRRELSYDIRLLYSVIKKYSEEAGGRTARTYMGAWDGYDADYPFRPFYEVYNYFQRYGLYKEQREEAVPGSSGKVMWKTTLERAQKIVSGGNLVFAPLYVRKKNSDSVFITECMAFIIDHTIDQFHSFLSLKKTGRPRDRFDYFEHAEFVISQLNQKKNAVFKDVHKRLLQSMIDFFEQYKYGAKGGKLHVHIRYFDMVWQEMVGRYLNRHFVRMDAAGERAVFDAAQQAGPVRFQPKTYNDIDDSSHHFSINIDHAAYQDDVLYIFDSKYYVEVTGLNYKQFSYHEILRCHYPEAVAVHNMLLLPGREGGRLHFSLAAEYRGGRTDGSKIIEQYLEPKNVMESYVEISCN